MERIEINTVTRQFKRTFDERSLNELGKRTRLCQRERTVTPFRLALSLIRRICTRQECRALQTCTEDSTPCVSKEFAISRFIISWRRKGLHSLCASCSTGRWRG